MARDLESHKRRLSTGAGSTVIFSGLMVFGAAGHDQSHPALMEEALFWARGGLLCLAQVMLTLPGQNLRSAASLICCQRVQLSLFNGLQIHRSPFTRF